MKLILSIKVFFRKFYFIYLYNYIFYLILDNMTSKYAKKLIKLGESNINTY